MYSVALPIQFARWANEKDGARVCIGYLAHGFESRLGICPVDEGFMSPSVSSNPSGISIPRLVADAELGNSVVEDKAGQQTNHPGGGGRGFKSRPKLCISASVNSLRLACPQGRAAGDSRK